MRQRTIRPARYGRAGTVHEFLRLTLACRGNASLNGTILSTGTSATASGVQLLPLTMSSSGRLSPLSQAHADRFTGKLVRFLTTNCSFYCHVCVILQRSPNSNASERSSSRTDNELNEPSTTLSEVARTFRRYLGSFQSAMHSCSTGRRANLRTWAIVTMLRSQL